MSDTATTAIVRQRLTPPTLYNVVLHDDDFTPMAFVVAVLVQIFAKPEASATEIMMTVHQTGRAVVGAYTREIATTKVLLTLRAAASAGHPLLATTEVA